MEISVWVVASDIGLLKFDVADVKELLTRVLLQESLVVLLFDGFLSQLLLIQIVDFLLVHLPTHNIRFDFRGQLLNGF